MTYKERFSRRQGFEPTDRDIRVRHTAPQDFREAVVQIAYEAGVSPHDLRSIICQVLRKRPDPSNWSGLNVAGEVDGLISSCEWYEVYDIIEALWDELPGADDARWEEDYKETARGYFTREMNLYFRKEGIGWQLIDGKIEIRGPEVFEHSVRTAQAILAEAGRPTSAQELHQALLDLSRRPSPDITGAIQHAIAALECVVRDVIGDPKPTLGELLKRNPNLVPPPLDQCLKIVWGYASEWGRHLREGREPNLEDAELVVGIASSVINYLTKRWRTAGRDGE